MNNTMSAASVNDSMHETDQTRVSLREIHECAYRALVAVGASFGEAATAADQVLFAELNFGEGVHGLLEDLALGTWPRGGMRCDRLRGQHRTIIRLDAPDRPGPLRQGITAVELAAAEPGPVVVTSRNLGGVSVLLDEPLIRAATMTGRDIALVQVGEAGGPNNARLARPNGDIGHGVWRPANSTDLSKNHDPQPITAVLCPSQGELQADQWLTSEQRQARRAEAALRGLLVSADEWRQIYGASRRFLVPE
jgi:hypothetical protein